MVTPSARRTDATQPGGADGPGSPMDDAEAGFPAALSPLGPSEMLMRQLRTGRRGLAESAAQQRLRQFGPNELSRRAGTPWWREVLAQFTHPLALLLELAAVLAFVSAGAVLGWTILAVVVLNAVFALVQEHQAERSVEALRGFVPRQCIVLRDGRARTIEAVALVPGDVLLVSEGQRISADARILAGEVEVDMSTLTGESAPVPRSEALDTRTQSHLHATDLLFSGTSCTTGSCQAVVFATGDHTELGRIASLSQGTTASSPLEQQVKKVAWLISLVAIGVGAAFLPLGLFAGLSFTAAFLFAIGLLVANVPEGLLPTITLALAMGVRRLANQGAVVKRLSAVQTLGSTTVICTDKTGTLTRNEMSPVAVNVPDAGHADVLAEERSRLEGSPAVVALAEALAACAVTTEIGGVAPDPTELALLEAAHALAGEHVPPGTERVHVYPFGSALRLSSTVDRVPGPVHADPILRLHVKGAPEAVLGRSTSVLRHGEPHPWDPALRAEVEGAVTEQTGRGLRVLAVARRDLAGGRWPRDREDAEHDLCFLGLVGLLDQPRPEVADAVRRCHEAGLRIIVITGDDARTAAEVAQRVGIGTSSRRLVTGAQVDAMPDSALSRLLQPPTEVICSRSSPENKMRVATVLQERGEIVAMTGDGVNDAPALKKSNIGVAMGRSGTDVAREAATMVLTDDNFATIVRAVEEGRRIYDNVRKFIVYIFAHAVPEVVPFLFFALSGGAVPLPLTVLQILAIDLGTETLPALALGREAAEPGIMRQPPRPAHEPLVTGRMLVRSWVVLGVPSAMLSMTAFFVTLTHAGWTPGADTTVGSPLHDAYVQATTATFAAIVACQVGTAFAARTERVSLSTVGLLTNPLLLVGIAFELVFAGLAVYLPAAQALLGTAALDGATLLLIAPFPLVVWGIDELYRAVVRTKSSAHRRPPMTSAETTRVLGPGNRRPRRLP